jgi:hypothetical protein
VELPFTPSQFFDVFAEYNQTFLLIVVVLWVSGAGAVITAARNPIDRSRQLTFFLAVLWAWNAIAYHALLFTRINPAAWIFAALFALQAALLWRAGRRRRLEYFSTRGPVPTVGVALIVFSFLYPFLSVMSHPYPATPTYGVPCPTAILTMGVFLTTRGGVPFTLALVPALWGLVGGSAAVLLGVPVDYVLLVAGLVLISRFIPSPVRAAA